VGDAEHGDFGLLGDVDEHLHGVADVADLVGVGLLTYVGLDGIHDEQAGVGVERQVILERRPMLCDVVPVTPDLAGLVRGQDDGQTVQHGWVPSHVQQAWQDGVVRVVLCAYQADPALRALVWCVWPASALSDDGCDVQAEVAFAYAPVSGEEADLAHWYAARPEPLDRMGLDGGQVDNLEVRPVGELLRGVPRDGPGDPSELVSSRGRVGPASQRIAHWPLSVRPGCRVLRPLPPHGAGECGEAGVPLALGYRFEPPWGSGAVPGAVVGRPRSVIQGGQGASSQTSGLIFQV